MAKKEELKTEDFVNPFEQGVNYETFLKAVGSTDVAEYCKGKLEDSQIDFLVNDIKIYKSNNK